MSYAKELPDTPVGLQTEYGSVGKKSRKKTRWLAISRSTAVITDRDITARQEELESKRRDSYATDRLAQSKRHERELAAKYGLSG